MISPSADLEHYRRRSAAAAGYAKEPPIAERICEYVDHNYMRQISLRDVAAHFGYSPCHLTNVFARSKGVPITGWIVRRRIVAAQQLLREENVSVLRACEAVGFNDLCYFTRQFVRYVGVTPGRYRASSNGKRQPDRKPAIHAD